MERPPPAPPIPGGRDGPGDAAGGAATASGPATNVAQPPFVSPSESGGAGGAARARAPRSSSPPGSGGPGGAAAAYDAIAAEYDRQIRGDEWMRRVLWGHYARLFRAGQRVLDVGCGTGIDAIYLAQRGIEVTGVDISAGMIAQLEEKVARLGPAGRVRARVMDAGGLAVWPDDSFDGLISAFAGLSAVPDLTEFAADAARLLRPGGRAMLHLLNRFSLWEWLVLLARGRWSAARLLGRQRERVFVIGGQPVRHHLYYPEEAYRRFFAGRFRLCGMYGLGSLRPPHTLRRIPAPLVAGLGQLERRLDSRRPFVNWGRLFVLELAKRG